MKRILLILFCIFLVGCGSAHVKVEDKNNPVKEVLIQETRVFRQPYFGETQIDGVYYCGMIDAEPKLSGMYCFAHYLDDKKTIRASWYYVDDNEDYALVRETDYVNGKFSKTKEVKDKIIKRGRFGEYEKKLFKSVQTLSKLK